MCTSAKQGGRTLKGGGYGIAQVETSIEKTVMDMVGFPERKHFISSSQDGTAS